MSLYKKTMRMFIHWNMLPRHVVESLSSIADTQKQNGLSSKQTAVSSPALSWGIGLSGLRKSLPTSVILGYYEFTGKFIRVHDGE